MSHKHAVNLAIVICIFFFVIPFGTNFTQMTFREIDTTSPAAIDIIQMLSDPELTSAPDVQVSGTSDEFSYTHEPHALHLNWTHTNGTSLDVRSADTDNLLPYYNDFIYFTQSFDWPYEEMPKEASLQLNLSSILTGSFLSEEDGDEMFQVYTWFIDPSGNWVRANFYYPSSESFQVIEGSMNYWAMLDVWGGMIEDEYGVQEDPTDTLNVRIGLAPTDRFHEYEGEHPWQTYNGSVIVTVASVKIQVAMDAEPNPATHLTPLYNNSYGGVLGDVFNAYGTDPTTPLTNFGYSMTSDASGNVYITGSSSIPYEVREEIGVKHKHQFLVKFDPRLEREWVVRNENQTVGIGITSHDEYIYTSGYFERYEPDYYNYNLMLTKWTERGQKIWEQEWGAASDQAGVALGVDDNGSVFVMVSDFNVRGPGEPYQSSSLLKFDTTGNILWNKPLPWCTDRLSPGELRVFESDLIYKTPGLIMCLDLEGNYLWNATTSWDAAIDENGTIYAVTDFGPWLKLSKIDHTGNILWTQNYEITYSTGWVELLNSVDIALTPTGEILVLGGKTWIDDSMFLLKYSINGTFIQSWTIGTGSEDGWYEYQSVDVPMMTVASSGLLYISSWVFGEPVWIEAYIIGEYTLSPPDLPSFDTMTIVIIGGAIGVLGVVGVIIYKRKGAT